MNKQNELKSQLKKSSKFFTIRITRDTQSALNRILINANKKSTGRKIRADQVLKLGLSLVTDDEIKPNGADKPR